MSVPDRTDQLAQEIVERVTGRPAYLCTDEEWAEAYAEARLRVGAKGPPTCPHCGDIAPYGDERWIWLSAHMDSLSHRWYWKLKKWWLGIVYG